MILKKVNFRQPKYIFPLIVAIPLGCLLYLIGDLFGGSEQEKPSDFLNPELPQAKVSESKNKMSMMNSRYNDKDNLFSAVEGWEKEQEEKESIDNEYSDEELERIMEETERRQREQAQIEEMQRRTNQAQQRLFGNSSSNSSSYAQEEDPMDVYDRQMEEIQRRQAERMRRIYGNSEEDDARQKALEAERIAKEDAERKAKEEAPHEVVKVSELQSGMFNTVETYNSEHLDAPLIKAMIDKTTKSTDGTRLRFKLLDDVIINDVKLPKGTYMYGVVSGFGNQRVKATISSVLVGSRFLKVNLSVYDVDGMEGFYVPASAFREFVKDAASGVASQSIQFNNSTSSGDGINPTQLALQALQNVYQSASGAISNNLRKNKAKIKYNTIVYLINGKDVK